MLEAASVDAIANRRGTTLKRALVRTVALATLLGSLFLSTAEAGNVHFFNHTPAVVDGDAVADAQKSSQQLPIRRGHEPSNPGSLRAETTQPGQEFAPQPNSLLATMGPVNGADAAAHDDQVARDMPAGINANGTIETLAKLDLKRPHASSDEAYLQNFEQPKKGLLRSNGVTGADGVVSNDAPPGPASIDELARALRYHPDVIYQYVRNNIEIDPVRGIHKGALGAVLDNRGSAFDQSQLMVSLLRTSGYDARFVHGVIKLSAQQFTDWYGVPATDVCAVLNLMGEAQIPVYSIDGSQGGSCPGLHAAMTGISIEHLWVKANIGGTWYTFDPSYKPHTLKSGVDLNVAAGYNAASFLGVAQGTEPDTPDTLGWVNTLSFANNLRVNAMNLSSWIRKNKPTATLSDIIGGKSIIPFFGGLVRQTQNPLLDTSWKTEEWADIPAGFKPTVRVRYQGIDQTFTSDAIYGKRLTITYNASNQPLLKLEGQTIGAPGSPVAPGADSVISFEVVHNAYVESGYLSDHAFDQPIKGGGTYLIVNGWGQSGRGSTQNYLKTLENLRAAGNAENSEPVLGSSLAVMGAQWLSQTTASASITDRLANAYTVQQHQVGIAGFDQGPYLDMPSNVISIAQMDGNMTLAQAAFDSNAMHSSILESSVVTQTSEVPAVSTVKLIDSALRQGVRFYDTGGGHYASVIKPALRGCEAYLGVFQKYVDQGYRLLIPRDCQMVDGSWKGIGYFVLSGGKLPVLGAVIGGGLSGGFYTSPSSPFAYNTAAINSKSAQILTNVHASDLNAGDPIDMVHGNFLYEHQDLKTGYGDSPESLNFQRLYSSGMKNQSGPLGKGWTHNYDMRLRTASDGLLGLGDRLAFDAVAAIFEHKVSLDALSDPLPSAHKYLVAVMAQRWLGDQLVNNTQIATFGLNSDVFSRLPDGTTFGAPPGKAVRLVVTGDTAKYLTLGGGYYTYNLGKVTSYVHPDKRQINFTWSGDLLIGVENSVGRSLTLAYSNNRLQSITTPQQTVRYTYNGSDNLVSETDPDGFITRFEYDQPGRMTKFYRPAFPNTAAVSNTYDTLGRVKTQTSAAGNLYDYYFAGSRSEEVGPGGSSRINYIDGESNLLQVSDPMSNWTVKDYDGQNRLVRETRPEGNRTEYAYNDESCTLAASGCMHSISTISRFPRPGASDPVLTQRFTYDMTQGALSTATDAKGQVTRTVYSDGLLVSTTRPAVGGLAPTTSITYTLARPVGNGMQSFYRPTLVTEKIDGTRSTGTSIAYGVDYTPTITTLDAGSWPYNERQIVTTFDNEGRLVKSERYGIVPITNTYDKRGNVIRTNANLLNSDEVIGYDADSREISRGVALTGGGAMVSCKRYNAMGDVVRAWGPSKTLDVNTCPVEIAPTPITDTSYDDHHRPYQVTRFNKEYENDGNGDRITQTVYNPDDSVKSIRKAVGAGLQQTYVTYTYNANGTVAQTTDAKGNTTANLYDGHDRLYRTHYPLEGQPGKADDNNYEQYTWDANGNLIALRKRDGQTIAQSFDALDRLATRTFPGGVGNVQYSYDLRGLKTASQYSDGSHTVTNAYDGLGQLTQTSAAGRTLSYWHDPSGNLMEIAWPDGFLQRMTYDNYGRRVKVLGDGATLIAEYAYDQFNRPGSVERYNGTRTMLSYDDQGWLNRLTHRFTSSTEDWIGTINHNQLGEIELANNVGSDRYGWIPPLEDSSYTTNALNQYTDGDGKVMRYDRNGNLTSDGVWTYSYDLDNRMKTANRSGTSATLDYDPEGRLVRTTVNGLETNLLYNGQDLVGEYDGAGKVTRRYIFSPGMDTPLAQYESNARGDSATWFYANQQGSIVALADGKGVTTGSQAYGAFGETEGTPSSRFGYTGQQYLAPLGLYYYKARMYSPALGRFLQTDPIGTKDDLNLYAYVKNNPVNFTDPTGLIAAKTLTGSNFNTNIAAAPATAPKLDAPAISMPAAAVADKAAMQVADVLFGHGDRHVDDPVSARIEILGHLPSISDLSVGAGFWGRTATYQYKAMPLPSGDLNIGTYYYIPGTRPRQ